MEISNDHKKTFSLDRRKFISGLAALTASSILLPRTVSAAGTFKMTGTFTVQQVIDVILSNIPGAPFKPTVDTIKAGNPDQAVKGIVTTMFPTEAVITSTIAAGANFIIAHEPSFYSHTDETAWLQNNNVFNHKMDLLNKHQIAIWRFHDHIHALKPDGVLMGVLMALNWQKYYDESNPRIITVPPMLVSEINAHLKKSLGISRIKFIGSPSKKCTRIALIPGAAGGRTQIEIAEKEKPDLLIVGEVHEWETAEYIRDSNYKRTGTALTVLGHSVSEEAGMKWLVKWLEPKLPGVKISHIPSKDPFSWM